MKIALFPPYKILENNKISLKHFFLNRFVIQLIGIQKKHGVEYNRKVLSRGPDLPCEILYASEVLKCLPPSFQMAHFMCHFFVLTFLILNYKHDMEK